MLFKQILLLFTLSWTTCAAQQEVFLYPGKIPNSKNAANEETKRADSIVDTVVSSVSRPTLTIYAPSVAKRNGTAVIVCPGGGYGVLLTEREGGKVAKAFNELGVTAFVLKYRLPSDRTMIEKSIGPLQDAQQAILTVRSKAGDWHIDPKKIGIMGFSAGGHLAATAGIHFNDPVIENPMAINLRPDFMILIYPVISFTDSIGHRGSRNNLLGISPTTAQINFFSNEFHVNGSTPPTFLTHASDDIVVPVANSLTFYKALKNNNIPCELHIYATGGHGYLKSPDFKEWFGRCMNWMKEMRLISGN